jgi:hypothetical protein
MPTNYAAFQNSDDNGSWGKVVEIIEISVRERVFITVTILDIPCPVFYLKHN